MQQTIEGGGVLNSLMQMFFKGVDKLLDSAAEYEIEKVDFGEPILVPEEQLSIEEPSLEEAK